MATITSFINKKGGVSKTTSALAFAAGLSEHGKVLLIDLDPQGNASLASGTSKDQAGTYELLAGIATLPELVQHSKAGYDFISADPDLNKEKEQLPLAGRELLLKKALKEYKNSYAHIIIDTPPAMDFLTVSAMVVTNNIIIPTRSDVFTLDGIAELWKNIQSVKDLYEREINVSGFLFNHTDKNTIINKQLYPVFKTMAEQMNTKIFDTFIRQDTKLKESQAAQESIFQYAPNSHASEDYSNAIKEFLEGLA